MKKIFLFPNFLKQNTEHDSAAPPPTTKRGFEPTPLQQDGGWSQTQPLRHRAMCALVCSK